MAIAQMLQVQVDILFFSTGSEHECEDWFDPDAVAKIPHLDEKEDIQLSKTYTPHFVMPQVDKKLSEPGRRESILNWCVVRTFSAT
jgi:hypothetical protein